jgi:mannose/fructose-specific phosphotransferase system component IIA
MSEPAPPIRGILLSHGAMADGIVDAVRHITGVDADALVALSNRGVSPDVLADEIRRHLGRGPTILFTDLQSGSCCFAAKRLSREDDRVVVITGVNLPLLLDFVMNRELRLDELVPHLLARGRAAIGCDPDELANVDRTAPR